MVEAAFKCEYIEGMTQTGRTCSKRDLALPLILFGALAVRLAYLLYYSSLPDWDQLTVDNYYHLHWAQRIADGDILGGATYFRAPFYVYCLATLIAIFGDSIWLLRLFGILVGAASVGMTFVLARRIFDRRTAIIASIVHAIYPTAIYFDGELLLDPLFTLLVQIALYCFLVWWDERTDRHALLVGLTLGLASITRPTALLFLAAAIVVIMLWKVTFSQRLRQSAWLVLGAAILIAPITIRNLVVARDPVLIASQGGINLYIGNNPHADGLSAVLPQPFGHNWQIQDISYVAEIKEGSELTPGEVSDYWSTRSREWMINNPVDFAKLYLRKLYFSISDREVSNNRDMDAFFAGVSFFKYHPLSFAVLFALGAIGAIVGWRRDRRSGIVAIVVLLFIFSNSLFFVNSRFRLPEIPLLITLSSCAVIWLFSQRRFATRAGMVALGSAALLFLVSFLPLLRFPFGANVAGTASRANFLYAQGRYQEAIEIGSQVLRADSLFPDANLTVGAAYFRLGNGDSAKYYFERERAFHPARPKAYTNLASYYLVNHEYDSAYAKLNRALLLRPYDLLGNSLLLRLVSADGQATSDDVLATISGTLARTDSNLTMLLEAAKVATERGLASDAESLLRLSLNQEPPPVETDDAAFEPSYPFTPASVNQLRAEAHYLLGYLFGLSGRFAESIEESRAAIEREPGRAEAYVNLISGYVSIGDLVTADSELQIALRRFPDHPQIRQIAERLRQ